MSFDEGDRVVLNDKHSEYDGQTGTITQVMKTMFDDETYTISFDEGQEAGVPPDQIEAAPDEDDEEEAEAEDDAADDEE